MLRVSNKTNRVIKLSDKTYLKSNGSIEIDELSVNMNHLESLVNNRVIDIERFNNVKDTVVIVTETKTTRKRKSTNTKRSE